MGVYTVAYKRVAVRQTPSLEGKVLDMVEKGQQLRTYDWDETNRWRKVHFKLPITAVMVAGWVLVKHDQLGVLLRSDPWESAEPNTNQGAKQGNNGYVSEQQQ